jgi:hypothetical protein
MNYIPQGLAILAIGGVGMATAQDFKDSYDLWMVCTTVSGY